VHPLFLSFYRAVFNNMFFLWLHVRSDSRVGRGSLIALTLLAMCILWSSQNPPPTTPPLPF
jgi:hypothetical protein